MPVLVGGAAVEFDTAGQFVSGDFDFAGGSITEFGRALQDEGFIADRRPCVLHRPAGWFHPTLLIGVELVSGSLFDGHTDRSRIRVVDTGDGYVHIAPTEDLIADRLAQWEIARTERFLLDQACALFLLAEQIDEDYLDGRIRTETLGALAAARSATIRSRAEMIRTTLDERLRALTRKIADGIPAPCPETCRNPGTRRTKSKRALLQRIQEEAKRQGRNAPFKANS